jgi:hypothetical protein
MACAKGDNKTVRQDDGQCVSCAVKLAHCVGALAWVAGVKCEGMPRNVYYISKGKAVKQKSGYNLLLGKK